MSAIDSIGDPGDIPIYHNISSEANIANWNLLKSLRNQQEMHFWSHGAIDIEAMPGPIICPPQKGHPLHFRVVAGTTVRSFNSVAPGRHVFSLEGEDGWQLSNQFACLQIKEIGVEHKNRATWKWMVYSGKSH